MLERAPAEGDEDDDDEIEGGGGGGGSGSGATGRTYLAIALGAVRDLIQDRIRRAARDEVGVLVYGAVSASLELGGLWVWWVWWFGLLFGCDVIARVAAVATANINETPSQNTITTTPPQRH